MKIGDFKVRSNTDEIVLYVLLEPNETMSYIEIGDYVELGDYHLEILDFHESSHKIVTKHLFETISPLPLSALKKGIKITITKKSKDVTRN